MLHTLYKRQIRSDRYIIRKFSESKGILHLHYNTSELPEINMHIWDLRRVTESDVRNYQLGYQNWK